jgi:hypothetical protein
VKRMTSVLTPAVVVAFLIALAVSAGTIRSVLAQPPAEQTPAAQPPATQQPPAQMPGAQTPAGPPAEGQVTMPRVVGKDTDHGTALMLLDRIAAVLDASVNRKASKSDIVGTTGSEDAPLKVVIDRAALDEMRAEIAQIKLLLQSESTSSVALRPREKNEGAR